MKQFSNLDTKNRGQEGNDLTGKSVTAKTKSRHKSRLNKNSAHRTRMGLLMGVT